MAAPALKCENTASFGLTLSNILPASEGTVWCSATILACPRVPRAFANGSFAGPTRRGSCFDNPTSWISRSAPLANLMRFSDGRVSPDRTTERSSVQRDGQERDEQDDNRIH